MAAHKLVHVPAQVLHAHFMVDAIVPTFKECPEAFYAVSVNHARNVLAGTMSDRVVVFQVNIAAMVVRKDKGVLWLFVLQQTSVEWLYRCRETPWLLAG